jgi:serine/threonine protein kinase
VSNKAEQPTAPAGRITSAPQSNSVGSQPPGDFDLSLAVGDRIGGRYVVKSFLGKGGMGAVYRALDEELDEEVALKLVRGRGDDDLLRDEVRLAQKVTHENVCRTYDLEDAGERGSSAGGFRSTTSSRSRAASRPASPPRTPRASFIAISSRAT